MVHHQPPRSRSRRHRRGRCAPIADGSNSGALPAFMSSSRQSASRSLRWTRRLATHLQLAAIALAAVMLGQPACAARMHASLIMLLGGVYVIAAVLAFIALRGIEPFGFDTILWAALIVIAADVGGYFAGRIIGGPKLWPAVSPKKTWAGLGWWCGTSICGRRPLFLGDDWNLFLRGLHGFDGWQPWSSQGGDLAESAVKRRFGVKDSGVLIPGHGGSAGPPGWASGGACWSLRLVTFSRGQPVFVW